MLVNVSDEHFITRRRLGNKLILVQVVCGKSLLRLRQSAISRVVVVLVLVILIVVAGAAYYFISSPSPSGTTTTSSSSSSSSTTSSTASSSVSPTFSSTSMSSTSTSSVTSTTPSSTSQTSTSAPTTSTTGLTSQTSTSSTTESTTCYTEATSNSSVGLSLVGFFSAYSTMSFTFQGTKNGLQKDLNLSYAVVYYSSNTYKVNINYTINDKSKMGTLWILNNGTILAGELNGKNYTGSTASTFVLNAFVDLENIYLLALQASTITAYFHSVGTSTTTIGTNSFTVTDYYANTTPETIQGCSDSSAIIDSYNVYLGTPNGSTLELVTSASFNVTLTTLSGSNVLDYQYQITGLTVA